MGINDAEKMHGEALKAGVRGFYLARGHSAEEAHAMTEAHFRGETGHIANEPTQQQSEESPT